MGHFFDAWNDSAMRHAMVVHFPIVLSILGVPLALLAVLVRRDRNPFQWTALAVYALLAASAYYAAEISGESAHDAVRGSLPEDGAATLEEHKTLGEGVWMYAGGAALLIGASLAPRRWARVGGGWLSVGAGCFIAWWVADTAEHGGRLVYQYGAGTKLRAAVVSAATEPAADPRVEFFRTQVRPLLVDACLRCHNPTRPRLPGGLNLTTIEGILKGGVSGPAVVPGDPDGSLLITAVRHIDPALKMPAKSDKLADEEIAVLERWVREGAVWEAFEYQPPPPQESTPERAPEVPPGS